MEQATSNNQPALDSHQVELDVIHQRIEQIYVSVEKTRKYFLWTLIITVAMIVLPLIGLAIVIPIFMQTLSSSFGI